MSVTATHNNLYIQTLQNDGVVVIPASIDKPLLNTLHKEVQQISTFIKTKINSMARPLRTYSDIAERQLGRLDFRCGFHADIFKVIEAPIVNFIQQTSPLIDFKYYWGAIPALPGAGPTDLHRDVFPVLNNCEGMDLTNYDIDLPPYYFTVLIPLIKITEINGPTEFIKGSHKNKETKTAAEKIYSPLLSPGDVVIFDGRTLHRGAANLSNEERPIAYITFIANWYHDQTFVINDYLFPDLAGKDR